MGLFDAISGLFESDIKSKALPSTSKTQQELEKAISEWLTPIIGKAAPTYPGQLVADMPELFTDAFRDYEEAFGGDIGELSRATISNLIAGKPAYTFDPTTTAERWQETFASPVMAAWRENVLPAVKEGFNLPGVLYSRGRGQGVAKEASRFYGTYVAPSLYASLEAGEQRGFQSVEEAAGRRAEALGLPYQQFAQAAGVATAAQRVEQDPLTAAYREYLRTVAEPGFAATLGAGVALQPTVDYAAFREPSMIEQIAMLMGGAGAGASGAAAAGGT